MNSPTQDLEHVTMVTTTTYSVEGMTCGHCVSAVSAELMALPGVDDVSVVLDPGGASSVTVTITTATVLSTEQVASALDDAGDYRLADPQA